MLEMHAITKALEKAREIYYNLNLGQRPSTIYIYSDRPGAIEYFARLPQSLIQLSRL